MNDGVVYGTSNTVFQSGNTTFNGNQSGLGNAIYQLGNLTIPSGKAFNHVFPPELRVSGNLAISGSFNHNTNQLILNGSDNQSIDHASNNLALHGLQVENQANGPSDGGYGISLNTNLNINSSLELYDGIIVSAHSGWKM